MKKRYLLILSAGLFLCFSQCSKGTQKVRANDPDTTGVKVVDSSKITLTGCSGKSIEDYGIQRDVYGTWMGRASWQNIAGADWLWAKESGVPAWRASHFDRALDVGMPLIPTDSSDDYNSMLKEAIAGKHDAAYESLGRNLAKYGTKTVYARLWLEFNMSPVKQDPVLFVKAWQHAVPLIRKGFHEQAQNGQQLFMVWCTNSGAPDPEPFYPGDDMVDIIGSDVYGWVWGDSDPTVREMLDHIFNDPYTLTWLADFANKHQKPTCIGEWANVGKRGNLAQVSHGCDDCPQYIDAIYDWTKSCKYGCRYVCYFNLPDGGVMITLDQTPKSLARLKNRAAKARLGKNK